MMGPYSRTSYDIRSLRYIVTCTCCTRIRDLVNHTWGIFRDLWLLEALQASAAFTSIRYPVYGIRQKSIHIIINEGVHMYTGTAYGYGIRIGYGYFDRFMSRFLPHPYTKPDRELQKLTSEMMSCPCYWETHPNRCGTQNKQHAL